MATPNSYRDPFWSSLASSTEAKLGLPPGILVSVLTNGERSNNDQVSEANAKTPFQIIPATQKAAIKKYGIDPYLSADNAAEVAGLLLKDSLDRNNGSIGAAVSEYHGGTDRKQWGPRTQAYAARVLSGMPKAAPLATGPINPPAASPEGSTFDRLMASQPKPNQTIAKIYDAYKNGVMSPEDAQAFEDDVNSGKVLLPRGGKLNSDLNAPTEEKKSGVLLPQEITNAYTNGLMSPEDKASLEADMKAGLVRLPPTLQSQIPTKPGAVPPTEQGVIVPPTGPTLGEAAIGAGEAALSTATGLTSGAVGMLGGTAKGLVDSVQQGTFGTPAGVKQIEQMASQGAQALTFAPRTETGQDINAAVGTVMQNAIPLAGVAGEMSALAQGVKSAMPAIQAVNTGNKKVVPSVGTINTESAQNLKPISANEARALVSGKTEKLNGTDPIKQIDAAEGNGKQLKIGNVALSEIRENEAGNLYDGTVNEARALNYANRTSENVPPVILTRSKKTGNLNVIDGGHRVTAARMRGDDTIYAIVSEKAEPVSNSSFGKGTAGAAQLDAESLRIAKSENLPVPIELTKGAASRDAAQLAFEKEQMKGAFGAPLRNRIEENNLQALQNFDVLVDRTNAKSPDVANSGAPVVKALSDGYQAAKNKTNIAYTEARKSPEALIKIDPNTTVIIGSGDNTISTGLIDYLNSVPNNLKTTGLIDHAKQYAVRLGIAVKNDDGTLSPVPTNVKTMEALRKEISQATGFEPIEIRDSTILKKIIDANTEPVAGPLYKKARALREQQARKYENRAIVARLVTNRKGMEDPKVYAEQVFQKSILNAQPDEITFLKRVLLTNGEAGKQAWQEMQGAMLNYIKEESTKGMGMDSADRPIVSPAKLNQVINTLDKTGRLDLVLGKTEAGIVRDLNDVVKYVNTVPPGTLINSSGTAGAIVAAITEAGATGALTGLPLPVLSILRALSKTIQNAKVKAKIENALNAKPKEPAKF